MKTKLEKISLKEILRSQTKDKLMELTYIYKIKGKSKLKKEQLVNALNSIMTDKVTIYENTIILDSEYKKIDKNEQHNNILKIRKLINLGYGKIVEEHDSIKFIIAEEAEVLFSNINKNVSEDIKRHSLVKKYILACIRLYGVIEKDSFITLFNEQNPEEKALDQDELNIHLIRCEKMQLEPTRYADCIVSESLLMFEGEIEDMMQKRIGKDFYVPGKEELLKYEDEYYVEKNIQFLQLEKCIYNKVKDKEIASGIVEDLTFVLRFGDGDINSAASELARRNIHFDSIKELDDFMNAYVNLANNTRKWSNKGKTPYELRNEQSIIVNKSKVGRNELCPCGSGKKYKKCCVNNI